MALREFGRPSWSRGQRLKFWLINHSIGRLLDLMFRTCRVEIINRPVYEEYFEGARPNVAVSWHRGTLFAGWAFARFHPAYLVSRSQDGEMAAGFCRLAGAIPVRGSSGKGGRSALQELERILQARQCFFAATVADGPQGPAYEAKVGLALLACRTSLPLVPAMWSSNRAWVMRNSWDKHMIPKPFAKVVLAMGQPIPPADPTDEAAVEEVRRQMQDQLNALTKLVDERCGHQDPA